MNEAGTVTCARLLTFGLGSRISTGPSPASTSPKSPRWGRLVSATSTPQTTRAAAVGHGMTEASNGPAVSPRGLGGESAEDKQQQRAARHAVDVSH